MTGRRGGDPTRRRGHKTPSHINQRLLYALTTIGRNANPGHKLPKIGAALRKGVQPAETQADPSKS